MDKEKFATENFFGLYVWIGMIAISLLLYFLNPDTFTPENIRTFFSANLFAGLGMYLLLTSMRAFTLIPMTPLLVAGIVVFPAWPLFWVNLGGIVISSAIIYYLAGYLGFDRFFRRHYPKQIDKLTNLLRNREFPIIVGWSFMMVLPTDLLVYVCSILRVSAFKTLLGVAIGEGLVCGLYIYSGAAGLSALFG